GAVRHPGAGGMTVAVVLHEPQDLVNIAHVVRALKNFGFRDLRLVSPREYDPYRVEGIAHQTHDVVARVARFDRLEDALLDCVHVVVLMLYELALARGDEQRPFKTPRRESPPATVDDLERLFADAEAALRAIDFFKTRQVEGVMRTLRDVIHRTPLDQREAKLVRAMAIEVVKYGERLARSRLHV